MHSSLEFLSLSCLGVSRDRPDVNAKTFSDWIMSARVAQVAHSAERWNAVQKVLGLTTGLDMFSLSLYIFYMIYFPICLIEVKIIIKV